MSVELGTGHVVPVGGHGPVQPLSAPSHAPADARTSPTPGDRDDPPGEDRAVLLLLLVLLADRIPPPWRSLLDPDVPGGDFPTSLRGGRVTDRGERAAIAARVAFGELPGWRRGIAHLTRRAPVGWPR